MERHPHSGNGRFNIFKMAILPKVIYRFSVTFIKIPIVVFTEIDKNNSKIHFELQKTNKQTNKKKQNSQSNLKKE